MDLFGELELCIMEHPAVLEAAVVAVPDERWQERPLAAVVVKKDVSPRGAAKALGDKVAGSGCPTVDVHRRGAEDQVGKFDKKPIRSQYADGSTTSSSARNDVQRASRQRPADTADDDAARRPDHGRLDRRKVWQHKRLRAHGGNIATEVAASRTYGGRAVIGGGGVSSR